MADRQRVYHPVTGEPFDLPHHKAVELRLNKGWLSHPLDPNAEPYITNVEPPAPFAQFESRGRVIEVGCDEACEATDESGHHHSSYFDDPEADEENGDEHK